MDNFIEHGDRILHTLGADAVSGDPLVVGTGLLGIAMNNGAAAAVIDTAVEGVYRLPKVSAAVILRGDSVFWDVSASEVDDNAAVKAAGDFTCGTAWEDAGNGVLFVDVKINRNPAAVT